MNNVYFPAIKRFDGDIESNFEMLINPRLEDAIARRIELSDLLTFVEDNVSFTADNIYNADGDLEGNRLVTGDGFSYNIQFTDLSGFTASVGDNANYSAYINIENTPSVTLYAEDADTGHNISLTIGPDTASFAAGANSNYLHVHQDTVELSSAGSLKLLTPGVNAATASVGQFLRLANANGTVEFATDTSIYSGNGTLASNRTLSGNSTYSLTMNNLTAFSLTTSGDITLTSTGGESEVVGLNTLIRSTGTGILEGTTITGNKVFITPTTDLLIDTGDASLTNGLKLYLYSNQAGSAKKGKVLTLLDASTGMSEWIDPESDYLTYDSNQTLAEASGTYGIDATSGNITITLPTAAGNRNMVITIRKTDASTNYVLIDANGSQTINGDLNRYLTYQNDFVKIMSDNSNWLEIGSSHSISSYSPRDLAYKEAGSEILVEPLRGSIQNIASSGLNPTDARLNIVAVYIPRDMTITGVKWYQVTAGNYTGDAYNGAGLYSLSAGTLTLVASTTNDTEIWKATSATMGKKAFSSTYYAKKGLYFIAMLYNQSAVTTNPTFGNFSANATNAEAADFTNSVKFAGYIAGKSSLPASQAMSGVTLTTNPIYLALY